jgi:ABC-type uncharacterized transport system substrate-binding protein
MAARVVRGELPASIPFQPCRKNRLLANPAAAKACGLALPDALLQSADTIIKP